MVRRVLFTGRGIFENYGELWGTLLWGIFKFHSGILGNYRGPYYRGFSKSIQAFPKITKITLSVLTMYFYSLLMSFYDGSNSSSFTFDAVSLF